MPYFRKFNDQGAFRQSLYTEEVDTVLRAHLQTLKDVYKHYSGRDALPNEEPFMSLSEFIDLVTASGIVDDTFGAREIGTLFNVAMMT